MNFPPNQVTISPVSAKWRVTAAPLVNSIWCVSSRTAQMLTKRRAVDFCRVATAICMPPAAFAAA